MYLEKTKLLLIIIFLREPRILPLLLRLTFIKTLPILGELNLTLLEQFA